MADPVSPAARAVAALAVTQAAQVAVLLTSAGPNGGPVLAVPAAPTAAAIAAAASRGDIETALAACDSIATALPSRNKAQVQAAQQALIAAVAAARGEVGPAPVEELAALRDMIRVVPDQFLPATFDKNDLDAQPDSWVLSLALSTGFYDRMPLSREQPLRAAAESIQLPPLTAAAVGDLTRAQLRQRIAQALQCADDVDDVAAHLVPAAAPALEKFGLLAAAVAHFGFEAAAPQAAPQQTTAEPAAPTAPPQAAQAAASLRSWLASVVDPAALPEAGATPAQVIAFAETLAQRDDLAAAVRMAIQQRASAARQWLAPATGVFNDVQQDINALLAGQNQAATGVLGAAAARQPDVGLAAAARAAEADLGVAAHGFNRTAAFREGDPFSAVGAQARAATTPAYEPSATPRAPDVDVWGRLRTAAMLPPSTPPQLITGWSRSPMDAIAAADARDVVRPVAARARLIAEAAQATDAAKLLARVAAESDVLLVSAHTRAAALEGNPRFSLHPAFWSAKAFEAAVSETRAALGVMHATTPHAAITARIEIVDGLLTAAHALRGAFTWAEMVATIEANLSSGAVASGPMAADRQALFAGAIAARTAAATKAATAAADKAATASAALGTAAAGQAVQGRVYKRKRPAAAPAAASAAAAEPTVAAPPTAPTAAPAESAGASGVPDSAGGRSGGRGRGRGRERGRDHAARGRGRGRGRGGE